jgi:hypothetical protein
MVILIFADFFIKLKWIYDTINDNINKRMAVYESGRMNKLIDYCLKTEKHTDICRFYNIYFNKINVVCNKQQLEKHFTNMRNVGCMKIEDYNNQTITRNKREYYVLVVQHIDMDKNSICPMSLLGFGFMVAWGTPYYFDTKEDRDFAIRIFKGEKNDKKKKNKRKKLVIYKQNKW